MNKHIQHSCLAPILNLVDRVSSDHARWLILLPLFLLGFGLSSNAQTDCCIQNSGKPNKLTLRYTGQGCSATNTVQSTSKYSCQDVGGGPNGDPQVYIVASTGTAGSGKVYFSGNVDINTTFVVSSTAAGDATFPSNTYFTIYSSQGGAVLQNVKIHTSCSAPIIPGDQFGSLVLMAAEWPNGVVCGSVIPPETCPTPTITANNINGSATTTVCAGDPIIYSTPDLGFPCLAYSWNFGSGASPSTATGLGPHSVTYSSSGSKTVSLSINNSCPGGTGKTICTTPPGNPPNLCFKIDPPASGSSNGVTYTINTQGGEAKSVTVTGSGITSVEVKGGPSSKIYTSAPFTNLTAPINPNTGQPYGISHFTICKMSSGSGGGGGTDCCAQGDKPNSLTLKYNGQSCANSNTSQSTDKYSCSDVGGGPNGDPSVYIKAAEKEDGTGKVYFTGNVAINANFTVNSANAGASEFPSNTWFLIYASQGGALLQKVKIHTSCSAPIVAGDQFGSLVLQSATFKNGTTCGPVTPPGPDCIDCQKSVTKTITVENCQPVVGKIGDFVWDDTNGNGIQDPGEPGIPAAFVMLMTCQGGFIGSTFTDANGMYMFNNLPAGSYKVFFANPNGNIYMPTLQDQGNDDAKDSDAAADGWTACFNLGQGQTNLTIDAGFKRLGPPPCTINLDVSNIICDGKGTSSTADDTYTFTFTVTGTNTSGAWQGGYSNAYLGAFAFGPTPYGTPVTLGPFPAGQFTPSNVFPPITLQNGVDISLSVSDVGFPSCATSTTVVSPGPCSPSAPASLGDFVWNDVNQNGRQDAGEQGVQGVTVKLYKCDGTFVNQTTTNASGLYSFTNLAPNMQYFVEFSGLPAGFIFTASNAAADNIDSDANTSNGRTDCVFLGPGDNNTTVDAGIYQPTPVLGSIGDYVWNDLNKNGIQEAGEPGVPNVTVKLLNCQGAVQQVTTTGATGNYLFSNLPAGSYIVEFSNLPAGFQFSPKDVGNDNTDSDANLSNGRTDCFNLATGQNDLSRDAGINQTTPPQPASVGDFVWNDLNKNGIQDAGEPGVQGVIVKLFTCNNTFIGQFSTNANGFYQFINLQPGSYFVQFSNLPAGYQFTNQDAGINDATDSDANPATGNTACFDLVAGQYDPTRDAGIFQSQGTGPAKIGDFVWFDTNANGIQDAGEPGIPNVFVILETCTGGFVNFAVTDGNGMYMFNNVSPGQYRIKFASPGTYNGVPVQFTLKDAGGDDSKDSDADWLGFTGCFTVNPGDINLTIDAGLTGETPPPVCTINGSVSNIVCNNNGTPNNAGDDTYTFTLIMNGSNTGEWGFDIPALNLYTLQYGQPYNLGPFNISSGTLTLLINDHDVANCFTTVTVQPPAPCSTGGGTCDNVTNGGTIGYDETNCQPFDPANIVSLTPATGGSGQLEYIWLKSTTGCPTQLNQAIPGATSDTYNPPSITQTTWYVRYVRRVGCTDWKSSNCVKKEVCTSPGGGCNITFAGGPGKITISGLNAPNKDVKVFNSAWQTVFQCTNNCNDPQVVTGLPAGTYYVDVQMWNANWQPVCSNAGYVTVSSLLLAPGGIDEATPETITTGKSINETGERNGGETEPAALVAVTEMKLFPNPASGYVMLEWSGAETNQPAEISLLNQLGQVVKIIQLDDASAGNFKLELADLRSGQYVVHFRLDGRVPVVKKLAVSH
jgi:hypothetical protein